VTVETPFLVPRGEAAQFHVGGVLRRKCRPTIATVVADALDKGFGCRPMVTVATRQQAFKLGSRLGGAAAHVDKRYAASTLLHLTSRTIHCSEHQGRRFR